MMEVLGWSHEIISPRDAASGLPTGKRTHTPFRAVIRMSQSTPLLQQAMTRNTVIPEVQVSFWREVELGAPAQYFSYVLKNCQVTSMRVWKPNKLDPSVSDYVSSVEIAFVYRTIEWRYEDGGITHEDTWETPVN